MFILSRTYYRLKRICSLFKSIERNAICKLYIYKLFQVEHIVGNLEILILLKNWQYTQNLQKGGRNAICKLHCQHYRTSIDLNSKVKPSRVGQKIAAIWKQRKRLTRVKDYKKQCILVSMKLTTAVIPIINTLVIDILIEATASISGILSYFHSMFSILLD